MASMKRGNESQNTKVLAEELALAQRIEFGIKSEDGYVARTIRKFAGRKSLYDDPEAVDALIDDLEKQLAELLKDANVRGRMMGKEKLDEFLEKSERWERTEAQARQIEKLSDKQAAKRLEIAFDELEKEGEILKADINIFRKNAELAGFNDREILQQLRRAGEDEDGIAAGFEKRVKSVEAAAVRRERTQSEIDAFREEFPDDTEYQWITISTKPCPDCRARAGSVMPYKEWLAIGIPGSGRTICGAYCMCRLIPATVADEMFPTVKEFQWDIRNTVLTTPKEAKILRKS